MPNPQPPGPEYLRLDRQLCFPLYAASRLMTRLYQPLLEPMGLTYPQYVVLMILWEETSCTVSQLCRRALLNTNTLTPLLKRLELSGYLTRRRDAGDERVVRVQLTAAGAALQERCGCIPASLLVSLGCSEQELGALKGMLDKLVARLSRLETEAD
jgi:DNA-binding MarR family transcriptional regulator